MTRRKLLTASLSAVLLLALGGAAEAASRRRTNRDHHRGRRFSERRSRRENPSYIYREERRRALTKRNDGRRVRLTDPPAGSDIPSCRSMTSVELIEGRRALISQRECIDAAGVTRVSPGTRRIVKFYDE